MEMLDKSSNVVLKILSKLAVGSTYKVITCEDVINASSKIKFDAENLKQIMDFLEKQEYINIKCSEENTFCYAISPKARLYLEQESKSKLKRNSLSLPILNYVFVALASFVGSILALIIFFYLVS